MYPVSPRFLQAILQSHTPVTEVKLFRTDGGVETLEHIGGSVSVDRGSTVHRTCTVQVADTSLIPRTPTDRLAIYGARLHISRGVDYGNGDRELVPLGVFRVDEVSGDVDAGPVTISGKSLECAVADDRFTAPYRATGTAVSAVTTLLRRSIPDAVLDSSAVADAPIGPRTWDVEGDPWTAVAEVASAVGAEVYATPDGQFAMAPLPDLATALPVWTISAGEGGAYIQASRGMSVDGVRNGWLIRGENTETNVAPVSALVVDTDPTSPTYWSGPFGHRPGFYSSPTITTLAAATLAGQLKLRAGIAPNASADLTALANPALETGDVLRVVYPDGTAELHQVASFSIDLDLGGAFTLQTIAAKEGT
ncbi:MULTISPECIES: DUF5047 domain-containing protein [Streptomyces]|jgi:hypothetical protein|uniref:DUF5047 domain-containing protein n=1 Tax=Streptomyces fradiae ATCC 10745 = DSM 40063 TaxID=1319510 RepID=A0A1Y2NUH9_STRFR|nr:MULTISPECIES: DUF5047 domain-containing protein [Streptomyces]KAF0646702.1 hypothetical protein K701_27355 [Streptomyces fradiae ATCC 10745 = DSM 40063]OSY50588.1 hypothetical protein BG846_03756 [Streptomyces fradiae ATCC 10745 = DSM 40063]QEV11616.1 DUF5047 domain-containing protein [Streptomyces fradiae ATCC 10745 = DSM 40063]